MKAKLFVIMISVVWTGSLLANQKYYVGISKAKSGTCAFSEKPLPPIVLEDSDVTLTAVPNTSICFSPDDRLVSGITTNEVRVLNAEYEEIDINYRYSIGFDRTECDERLLNMDTYKFGGRTLSDDYRSKISMPATNGGKKLFYNDDKILCIEMY